ncbi:NAD(P)/FAD-dependent oxidoreductase [Bradyrhizobium elkanii]|uniref:NAD(P)/FAD-dependent oxidoreductase n=1 Tax=Bradyrhizobium sp. BRP56 TaxID=2793819 RepID=UPI001CD35CCA|nr:FAD-dependent oxidoreductase [Bradyrhizobium sp. BRP56]MCA1398983.1 FAD-binding oxidoreductase [Bradyrhizobium sp. BRP56]
MPETVDCLVVGGGLLGSALAYYLVCSGSTACLVEKDQLNQHASGRNAGSLHFQLEYRMIEHGLDAAKKAAEALPLHLDAAREWSLLSTRIGENVGVLQSGGMMLAETNEQALLLERKTELERSYGLENRMLSSDEIHRRAPYLSSAIVAAALCPLEGKANPRGATLAFAKVAEEFGARIRAGIAVTGVKQQRGRWRTTLSDGSEILARKVAIAAGPWSARIAAMAGIALPVVPIGLMMAATVQVAPFIKHLIQHAGRRLSLNQSAEGTILVGGGWPARLHETGGVYDLDLPPEILPSSIQGNLRAAVSVVPRIGEIPVLRIWSGATLLVADQLPLVGALPRRSDLFIATGGSAFTLGPTYARVLASKILEKPVDLDVSRFDPGRFVSLNNA